MENIKRWYYEQNPWTATILPKRSQNSIYYEVKLRHESIGMVTFPGEFTNAENAKAQLAVKHNLDLTKWKES